MTGSPRLDTGSPRLYANLFFLALLAGVAFLCWLVVKPFLVPLGWAVVLAVVLRGTYQALVRKLRRPGLAASVLVVGLLVVVLAPGAWFVSALFHEASTAAAGIQRALSAKQIDSLSDVANHPLVQRTLATVEEKTGLRGADVLRRAGEIAARASSFVAQATGGLLLGVLDALLAFALTLFLLFFLLRDGDDISSGVWGLLPLPPAEREDVVARHRRMLQAIFRGSLLTLPIQGLVGGTGWALAGLPSPLLAGVVMTFLALLPVGGTALLWIPGALWLALTGHVGAGVFLFLWSAVITGSVDNVLRPLLIGGGSGDVPLSSLIVVLGVLGGMGAFGLLGIFLGPMVLAILGSLLDVLRRLAERAAGETPPAAATP